MKYFAILALLLVSACSRNEPTRRERAVQWLWSQQEADGGWHSKTYGLLRSGQSLTPFVLHVLRNTDRAAATSRGMRRGVEFIAAHMAPDGSIGKMDENSQDYPNYATSLAARVLLDRKDPRAATLIAYLRTQQFNKANGWNPTDAPYGAWGMGGVPMRPPATGHVDLSMTRHVIEALREAGIGPADPAMEAAAVYLEKLQNPDGGFYFSNTEEDTNKAGGRTSYGTATVDGILALLAIDRNKQADRAVEWLQARHRNDEPHIPGFAGPQYDRWHRGLAFYYAGSLRLLGKQRFSYRLPSEQRADGSFANPENLVKEDDPIIATAFALMAGI